MLEVYNVKKRPQNKNPADNLTQFTLVICSKPTYSNIAHIIWLLLTRKNFVKRQLKI